MAKKRSPERDKAFETFKSKKGKITPKEIADQLGVPVSTVRKWKSIDEWEKKLPRRGGQPGNKNAEGHGAPKGNTNAQTHGAYSMPRIENWDEDKREQINSLDADFGANALDQLKRLKAKEMDLEQRIAELNNSDEALYLDRVMTMELPDGGEMKYRSESSAFARRMVLEGELNKVQGRIIKLLDSFRNAETEKHRLQLEKEKFSFAKQKALGEFDIDDYGNIVNDPENEPDEIIK